MQTASSPIRVAIQGELGSFSHEAALALAPGDEVVPCALSAEVFRRLVEGDVDRAVIPIENSLAGSVLEHYDLLLANEVRIEQEHLLRIRHNLIAQPGAALADLRQVFSHPIALDQCRGFFREHPHLQATAFYDTAGSVKHVVAGQPLGGAIASRQAAAQYGGALLAEGIEDNPENYTRFLLIRTIAQALLGPLAATPRHDPRALPGAQPAHPRQPLALHLLYRLPDGAGRPGRCRARRAGALLLHDQGARPLSSRCQKLARQQ